MITLSTSGSSVIFTFSGNSGYLQDGTIEVPVNSLSLITDESGMATFRKSASNDIFISARYEEFGMTKAELEAWYKENMVGETGGGGGVDSGTVQTMIDESISGLAESSAVTEEISEAVSGKIDTASAVTNVRVLTVSAQNQLQIEQSKGNETGSTFVGIVYTIGSGLTWNYQTKNIAVDSSTVALKSDVSGKVDTDTYSAYTAATDARITEDEEVTAAGINAINDALSGKVDTSTYSAYTAATDAVLSGKQDTLSAGTNITISGNVISAEGGGGKAIEAGRGISITTGATADTVSFNLPISGQGVSNIVANIQNNTLNNGVYTHYNALFGFGNTIGLVNRENYCQGNAAFGEQNHIYTDSYSAGVNRNLICGYSNIISATTNGINASFACGGFNKGNSSYQTLAGYYNNATKMYETSLGKYNVSNTGSTDADNTLFSVGNGTADNARHNAFEIRQNGDIYISSGGTDIKLQDNLGGGVSESVFSAYTAATDSRMAEDEEVTAAGINAVNDKFDGLKLKKLTQSEYNALVSGGTVDNSTLYIITNVVS